MSFYSTSKFHGLTFNVVLRIIKGDKCITIANCKLYPVYKVVTYDITNKHNKSMFTMSSVELFGEMKFQSAYPGYLTPRDRM
jgi:hypothetical protein